jgi:hypothetical protein
MLGLWKRGLSIVASLGGVEAKKCWLDYQKPVQIGHQNLISE